MLMKFLRSTRKLKILFYLSAILVLFLFCNALADYQIKSEDIRNDTTDFKGVLSSADNTVQKALNTIDNTLDKTHLDAAYLGLHAKADTAGAADTASTAAGLSGTPNISIGTVNGLTPTSQTTGFTLSGGTTSKTLTLSGDATISGTPEPALGNPASDGYVLSSTAAGVRSWIAAGAGSGVFEESSSVVRQASAGTVKKLTDYTVKITTTDTRTIDGEEQSYARAKTYTLEQINNRITEAKSAKASWETEATKAAQNIAIQEAQITEWQGYKDDAENLGVTEAEIDQEALLTQESK